MDDGTRNVSEKAIKLNMDWIYSLENCLANCGNHALTKDVMRAAGENCSIQISNDCKKVLGKLPQSVDDLFDGMNQRRSQYHNINSIWEREGNTARLILEECNCILVKSGLVKINPTHCLCSQGMMENLFSKVHRGTVNVDLIRSIGNGDDVCEFFVTFHE